MPNMFNPKKSVAFVLLLALFSAPLIANANEVITNQAQLEAIGSSSEALARSYVLGNNIELTSPFNSAGDYYIEGKFNGTLDGNSYKIMGLRKPLFDEIGPSTDSEDDGALVKNLTLIGTIVGGEGFLAKRINVDGEVQNVGASGSIVSSDTDIGGLVGRNNGTITDSYADVEVSSTGYEPSVGGLVGVNNNLIERSYSLGDVSVSPSSNRGEIGGLIGQNSGLSNNSYSQGSVSVEGVGGNAQEFVAGGLVGVNNYGTISNSFASGTVSGTRITGGLVGFNHLGTILNTNSKGEVTGHLFVGGLIGNNSADTTIRNSYSSSNVSCGSTSETCSALIGISSNERVTVDNSKGIGQVTLNSIPQTNPDQDSDIPAFLTVVGDEYFTIDSCYNSGQPILRSLKSTFSNSCEVNQSTSSSYPINTSTGLSTEKKQATSNFRFELNDLTFKKLGIQIVDLMKNTEPNLVNSITVSVNSIAEVVVQKNQELQIKLNYASVLPVQLWVRSADGEMVFLGELNFDSEGRAILPSLIFTMSGKKDLIFIQYEDVYQSFDLQFQVGKLTLNVVP